MVGLHNLLDVKPLTVLGVVILIICLVPWIWLAGQCCLDLRRWWWFSDHRLVDIFRSLRKLTVLFGVFAWIWFLAGLIADHFESEDSFFFWFLAVAGSHLAAMGFAVQRKPK